MNIIPHWVFAAVAVIGICLTFYGRHKKKINLVFPGSMASLIGSLLFIFANFGAFKPNPLMVEGNLWRAEAYGIAEVIKKLYPNDTVAIVGWMRDDHKMIADYMDTLEKLGIHTKYVAVGGFPPIGVPISTQMEMLGRAIEKCGDAKVFVYRGAVLHAAYLDSDAFSEDYRFIQTNYEANEELWDEGIITAQVRAKIGVDSNTLSMTSVEAAYKKGIEVKINDNKR